MQLLIGIHLDKLHNSRKFAQFLREQAKKDSDTFLTSFYWPSRDSRKAVARAKNELGPKRVLEVKAETTAAGIKRLKDAGASQLDLKRMIARQRQLPWDDSFEAYEKGFKAAIAKAKSRDIFGKNVNVIFFGGADRECFKRVQEGALKELPRHFESRFMGSVSTAPQWVYKISGKRALPLKRNLALWKMARERGRALRARLRKRRTGK